MARNTTYTCDQCGKPVEPPGEPVLKIEARREPHTIAGFLVAGDFCSWVCAVTWLANQSHRYR